MSKKTDEFRYEAVDRAGEGALFVVYKARDKLLNKQVALKVLRQRFQKEPHLAENIKRAVQTTIDLPHPNIVRVYSTGEEDGYFFIATEFVRGESLAEKLGRESPLPRKDALELLIPVGEAISFAHQNGVVHGDLRPRNVLIGQDGKIKVTDFALASGFAGGKISLPEISLDTARYVAPEVAQGASPTAAADLYSLGVIAYQMLTATVPFDGKSARAILDQHITKKPPPPSNFNPSISPDLEDIFLKLLMKDPHDRYSSTSELLKDLRQVEAGRRLDQAGNEWRSATLQRPRRTSAREQIAVPTDTGAESTRRSGVAWNIATILASILLIFGACLYVYWTATSPKEVTVPDVVGKPVSEAQTILGSVGLSFTEARRECDAKIPEGCVITSMPPAGRKVKEGRTISCSVSSGQELIAVPDLTNITLDKGKKIAAEAGLIIGKVQEVYNPSIPKGQVVSQAPGPTEKVAKNTALWLQVSRGPEPTAPESQAPAPAGESSQERNVHISIEVPQGPTQQEVKIVVRDNKGTRTAYQEMHGIGDKVEEDIPVFGNRALVRVYLAGTLVDEKEL